MFVEVISHSYTPAKSHHIHTGSPYTVLDAGGPWRWTRGGGQVRLKGREGGVAEGWVGEKGGGCHRFRLPDFRSL